MRENRGNPHSLEAFEGLERLLAPGGETLITMPLNYNRFLDGLIAADALPFTNLRFMKRTTRDNQWVETDYNGARDCSYNNPHPRAGAIVICSVK